MPRLRLPALIGLIGLMVSMPPRFLPAQRIVRSGVAVHKLRTEVPTRTFGWVAWQLPARTTAPTGAMVTGGIVGGALGFVAGFVLGAAGTSRDCDDTCWAGPVVGAVLGETIGIPVGVNVAAKGRGKLPSMILGSMGAGVVFGGLAGVVFPPFLLFTPAAQIYTTIRIARRDF